MTRVNYDKIQVQLAPRIIKTEKDFSLFQDPKRFMKYSVEYPESFLKILPKGYTPKNTIISLGISPQLCCESINHIFY